MTKTDLPPKKIPMRKCLGCNEMKPKRELIRVVRSPEGAISLDKTGKANGRGAYVCPNPECFKKLRKRKSLERAFKCQIPAEVYEGLEGELTIDS
ncbi:MAG: YlxR family protein [Oscillospiraceae bacterium]|nr:YlxR family protein [Oscillospiraceae bacterium]